MIPIVRILVASKKDDRSQAKTEYPAHVDWTLITLRAPCYIFCSHKGWKHKGLA